VSTSVGLENDKIVNNTKDICDTFNTFFVNVANDIGKDVIFDGNSHPSILKIKNNLVGKTLVLIVLLTSVVICLLSTGAPARKSLDEI
jgi:hypothetical protein